MPAWHPCIVKLKPRCDAIPQWRHNDKQSLYLWRHPPNTADVYYVINQTMAAVKRGNYLAVVIHASSAVRVGSKFNQIGPKWDKSGTFFKDQFQYILAHLLGANLMTGTHYVQRHTSERDRDPNVKVCHNSFTVYNWPRICVDYNQCQNEPDFWLV